MPADPSLKKITLYLTPDQIAALHEAMGVDNQKNKSDVIRRLIAEYCESKGVTFPEDLPKWGQRRDYLGE